MTEGGGRRDEINPENFKTSFKFLHGYSVTWLSIRPLSHEGTTGHKRPQRLPRTQPTYQT